MAVLFGVAFVTVYKSGGAFAASKSVVIGTKDEVYYSGSATRQDAETLGNALKSDSYFTDRGADVLLTKGTDSTTLSFVVQDKFLSQPGLLGSFEEVARQVAPSVGGYPVQLRIMNTAREAQLESAVGKVDFPGNDSIYYLGTVKQSEAQALGKSLQSVRFFQGRGNDVFLIPAQRRNGDRVRGVERLLGQACALSEISKKSRGMQHLRWAVSQSHFAW